ASVYQGCVGQNNGNATVGVRGGVSPYAYSWTTSPVQTNVSATGLTAGTYTVTVTDNNSCAAFVVFNITPDVIPTVTFKLGKDSVMCDTTKSMPLNSYVTPVGGVFSGPNISANAFQPFTAGIGKYVLKYVYTNAGGCSDSATQTIRVDSCSALGIVEVQSYQNNVRIYPNPNNGQFTISGLTKGSTLLLYNDIGMLVSNGQVSDETMQLNIASMPNGVYMVRIIYPNNTKVLAQKVIKLD
ncbi:MAG TPA: T9SS type A sorting domain-containing protein, partial [Bacteroidia bacterium]|nr:T9SS type A sorting domain-containing protein [Bacteroidia bacterium]